MTNLRSLAARTVQVAVSAVFFYAAYQKLTGGPVATHTLQALGLGEWFRYFTGLAELAGAIGLFVPRLATGAAAGLAGVMVGAAMTHFFIIGGNAIPALVLLAACLFLAWQYRFEAPFPGRGCDRA